MQYKVLHFDDVTEHRLTIDHWEFTLGFKFFDSPIFWERGVWNLGDFWLFIAIPWLYFNLFYTQYSSGK